MSHEIKSEDLTLKLEVSKPSERAQNKALQELRETSENIQTGLKELKKLLQAESELNIPKTNDEWLMKFLRVSHFYAESARDLIRRYYNLQSKYNEITNFLIPSKLKAIFEANLVCILPQRDQQGRRIVVSLGGKQWNHKLISIDDVFSASTLCSELLQLEPETQINGIVYIMDMQGLTLGRALHYTPYRTKRLLDYIQSNIPLRIKGFHVVNQPKIFQPIYAAAKPFFTTKFAKRIVLHGSNYESLHRYISPECLPECYGGFIKTELMCGRETYELLSNHEKYFESLQTYGFKRSLAILE
ncbi:alpha-tocopherol transfer protein-like [Lucilia sericata]|uniref:alpha-tocopherol transfer protein-like n=1 Tax=Lucilia sericata TaxID=13632 RepID=UPI0018A7FC2E|nr:alpha-tocopherol transfer protein-like [Lucilia sericata]